MYFRVQCMLTSSAPQNSKHTDRLGDKLKLKFLMREQVGSVHVTDSMLGCLITCLISFHIGWLEPLSVLTPRAQLCMPCLNAKSARIHLGTVFALVSLFIVQHTLRCSEVASCLWFSLLALQRSDLDVALPDGATDDQFMHSLATHLPEVTSQSTHISFLSTLGCILRLNGPGIASAFTHWQHRCLTGDSPPVLLSGCSFHLALGSVASLTRAHTRFSWCLKSHLCTQAYEAASRFLEAGDNTRAGSASG